MTQTDGELNLEPLKRVLEQDFHYANHQDAEELILGACQVAQELYGWVSQPAAQMIGDHLGVSINRVYALLTFYADFRTEPPGRHVLLLCHGTACYVQGSQRLIETLRTDYGIEDGEVSQDGELTLHVVNGCLGVCDIAPVIQVDHSSYCGRLDPERLRAAIARLKRGEALEERDETE